MRLNSTCVTLVNNSPTLFTNVKASNEQVHSYNCKLANINTTLCYRCKFYGSILTKTVHNPFFIYRCKQALKYARDFDLKSLFIGYTVFIYSMLYDFEPYPATKQNRKKETQSWEIESL